MLDAVGTLPFDGALASTGIAEAAFIAKTATCLGERLAKVVSSRYLLGHVISV